ncbi:MAG TPA: carboxypeptidase-like regulatory domain-containing protein [Thermoanaerobaculia bacterium]|jgi:hypothetical protein
MTQSRRSLFPWPGPALLGLVFLLAALAPAFAARYAQGERVQVTGIVADAQGQPLADVRVVFEASRTYFSMRQLRRTAAEEVRRVSATTNARGEYTIEWPWDSYFNHFELVAGVPVRARSGERLEELTRQDVTRRVLAGSPAVVGVTVENRRFLDNLRQFLASIQTDDQRKVYQEMGKPDRIRNVQYPGHLESSWWYFESGRVYRFRDGRLEQVVPFEPVRGL